MTGAGWAVAFAVRPLGHGKSRMRWALTPRERGSLVLAMTRDVVAAASAAAAVEQVFVVTADPTIASALGDAVETLGEPRPSGLNAAFLEARRRAGTRPLALVAADLPQLSPRDLDTVLDTAVDLGRPVVVGDLEGVGTTILASADPADLNPRFGTDSLRRHIADGARDLSASVTPGTRRDIDTVAALAGLASGPTGLATRRWLARHRWCIRDEHQHDGTPSHCMSCASTSTLSAEVGRLAHAYPSGP